MDVGKSVENLTGNFSKLVVARTSRSEKKEPAAVENDSSGKPVDAIDPRPKLTDISSTVAAVSEAKDEIDQIVKSLGGIVKLAEQDESPDKIEKLTKEGNDLVGAIKTIAYSVRNNDSVPLAGDPIRVELESTLGKRLEILFPDDAANSFGIGTVNLSKKEFIINLQTSIEQAKRSLEQIGDSVRENKEKIKQAYSKIEVAIQNSESARSSVRDVDEAAELVDKTANFITQHGDQALAAISAALKGSRMVSKEG